MTTIRNTSLALAAALCGIIGAANAAETVTTTTTSETVTAPGAASTTETTSVTTSAAPPLMPGATTRTEFHWETTERTLPTGARALNFFDFDTNSDHMLTRDEIGRMLFKLYDTDGNEVIDNIEFERRAVVTVMPMEKSTTVTYDFDGDGLADKTERTFETFKRETLLTRFDENKDGLSPHEFTQRDFLAADVDNDKVVDLKEWQGSYIETLDKSNKDKAALNNRK